MSEVKSEDEAYDVLLDVVQICIERQVPELAGDREELEDVIDRPTMNKIIEVCTGIDLDAEPDPNLLVTTESPQDGTA